jgi:glycosyltransferase involved in cell wall biosynthesis
MSGPRVLHVVQLLQSGGAEVMVRGLTAGLGAAGVDVGIVSIYPDGLDDETRATLGVPIFAVGRSGRFDVAFFPRLLGILRAERPAIVHAHLHAGKYAGRLAAVLAGVPNVVFTEHGDKLTGPVNRIANRFLHARTARFVVFTPDQRDRFSAREGVPVERISVIPNGVAAPAGDRAALRASLGLAPDTFAVYLPARLAEEKNHLLALRGFAGARQAGFEAVLVLAGSGPAEATLRNEAESLGLGAHVRFLGFRPDAARLCVAMDAFALPSLWEHMPLALGEGMRAGLPVVTTPWTGVADFVSDGETGFVAADFSPAAFAAALLRLRDEAVRRAVAIRGKAFADVRFDPERTVREHVALYASLTGPR